MTGSLPRECVSATISSLVDGGPVALARRLRIELRAVDSDFRSRGRRILGIWDPPLRRIEIFECSQLTSRELVWTFVHEIGHALLGERGSCKPARGETEACATGFADTVTACLPERTVVDCAESLRAAVEPSSRSLESIDTTGFLLP